ncbi:MAG: hypothetical protein AAF657_28380 [Acidobacteriota bacterium]
MLRELIPRLIGLTSTDDAEVARRAVNSLQSLDGRTVADWLEVHGTEEGFIYFAGHRKDVVVIEAILKNRRTPGSVLEKLAPTLNAHLQEVLILRQDAIVERPEIVVALEKNPALTSYCKRRIWELREHLLPPETWPVEAEPAPIERRINPAGPQKAGPQKAGPQKAGPQSAGPQTAGPQPAGPRLGRFNWRELTLMSCDLRFRPQVRRTAERMLLEQLPYLQAAERSTVARQASAKVLEVLVYDTNPAVARAALGSPRFRESALLRLLASDHTSPAALELVAGHARWRIRYDVRLALCRNPRTPPAAVADFLRTLQPRDLKALVRRSSGVSIGVRRLARNLYLGMAGRDPV